MASPAATSDSGDKSYVARMMIKHGVETIPEDKEHSPDAVSLAFTLIDLKKFPKDPPPFKKFKNVHEEYGKGKQKVVDTSSSEEDHNNEDEKEVSSDSGNDNVINFKNPKKRTSKVSQVNLGVPVERQESVPNTDAGKCVSIFSFLWVVRIALIAPASEYHDPTMGNQPHPSCGDKRRRQHVTLTTEEVIRRVSSTFGDAHLLDMKVPLKKLVMWALRIFSSKTPPPGVSNFSWEPLVSFEKSTRSWTWTGPALSRSPGKDTDSIKITTPEAWGLTRRVLNKLVENFAEWLKAAECTFSRIASLPPPPLASIQQPTPRERFKETRNIKSSVCTISPRSQEVTDYFRKEEALRYLMPENAFFYTTCNGRKSTVAPLRRCSAKPSKKTREHFILKPNRPPAFTVVCLVRDAAARLPNGIGTRSDVCSLVKDSQFVIQDVSEDQLNQVVSGALDRLHYQLDPCVVFDKDTRLWHYLHGNRREEDFAEDCTSSTKMRKKFLEDGSVGLEDEGKRGAINEGFKTNAGIQK